MPMLGKKRRNIDFDLFNLMFFFDPSVAKFPIRPVEAFTGNPVGHEAAVLVKIFARITLNCEDKQSLAVTVRLAPSPS